MQNTDALLARLADIEIPAEPEWAWLWAALLALLLGALAAGLLWRLRRSPPGGAALPSPPREACNELDRLQARWRAGEVADRETAYRLATILRLGLALPRLTPHCPAPLRQEEASWRETIALLQRARYRKTPAAIGPELFDRVRRWLSVLQERPPC